MIGNDLGRRLKKWGGTARRLKWKRTLTVRRYPVRKLHKIIQCSYVLLLTSSVLVAAPQDTVSEETLEFFQGQCASCHTIGGGRLGGPDLKGATDRREADWLARFIRDPQGVIESGDPYALKILSEANGVVMPTLAGIDAKLAEKLVNLIRVESALEKSHFEGMKFDDRALTDADIERGRSLFLGLTSFENGAPACASCHALAGLAGFGGLEGRKALSAWLTSPPSAVMQPVFKGHSLESEEILGLVAAMKDAAESGIGETESSTLSFILSGIGLAAGLMVLFDGFWRKRFRSVRRTLVENS